MIYIPNKLCIISFSLWCVCYFEHILNYASLPCLLTFSVWLLPSVVDFNRDWNVNVNHFTTKYSKLPDTPLQNWLFCNACMKGQNWADHESWLLKSSWFRGQISNFWFCCTPQEEKKYCCPAWGMYLQCLKNHVVLSYQWPIFHNKPFKYIAIWNLIKRNKI